MAQDPLAALYARYPVNLPEAAVIYGNLSDRLMLASGSQARDQSVGGVFSSAGRMATNKIDTGRISAPPFKPRQIAQSFVLGTAINLMKQNDSRIVAVIGEVFGFTLTMRTVGQLATIGNPIGAAALLAYEIYMVSDKIVELQEQRHNSRLMAEYDLILLHWGKIARQNRKEMTAVWETGASMAHKRIGWTGEIAERVRRALTGPKADDIDPTQRQDLLVVHKISRQRQINWFANKAKEINEYLELAITLKLFFARALIDPEDDDRLGARLGYRGHIDNNRDRFFSMYAGWFRDIETRLAGLKKDYEDCAVLYAWLEPENPLEK